MNNLHKKIFENIIGQSITNTSWLQVQLPVKEGGFGIGDLYDIAVAAYTANIEETFVHVCETFDIIKHYAKINDINGDDNNIIILNEDQTFFLEEYKIHKQNIIYSINNNNNNINMFEKHKEKKNLQYFYSHILSKVREKTWSDIMSNNIKDKARYNCLKGINSGAFLWACPKCKHSIFNSLEFKLALLSRLGEVLPNIPTYCNCSKKTRIDGEGTHLLACNKGYGSNERHKQLQHDIWCLAKSAGYSAEKESKNLFNIYADDGCRGDILIKGTDGSGIKKDLLVDITVGVPTCPSYVRKSSQERDYTINKLNTIKNDKYLEKCNQINIDFMPMAFETFGAWSKEFKNIFNILVKNASELNQSNYANLHFYWSKRISCTLMRYNSKCIIQRIISINGEKTRWDNAYNANIIYDYNYMR